MFRTILTTVVFLASAVCAHAQTGVSRLSVPVARDVLHLNQDILLTGEVTIHGRLGPLTTSSAGFGIEKNVTKLTSSPVSALPRVSVGNPASRVDALDLAAKWTRDNMPGLRNQVLNYIKPQGISSVVFTFTQEINVMVQTPDGMAPKKQAISFVASFDASGRALYGSPKIVDPDPIILEAMYTPLHVSDDLPQSWSYPGAGNLKYRLLNRKGEALTNFREMQLNGIYDDRDSNNPDSGLRCLMDLRNPGCSGPVDISTLLNQTGASYAVVDYVRQIEPDYVDLGNGEMRPKGAFSYDERQYDCKTYTNKGYYGYLLSLRAERYLAEAASPVLRYQKTEQFGGRALSPTEPFNKSLPVASLGGRNPDSVLITPQPQLTEIIARNDPDMLAQTVYVAPLRTTSGNGTLNQVSTSLGLSGADIGGGMYEYTWGRDPLPPGAGSYDYYWHTGQYDNTLSFYLDSQDAVEDFVLTTLGFDDYVQLAVNGQNVYFGSAKLGSRMNALAYSADPGVDERTCRRAADGTWECAEIIGAGSSPPNMSCSRAEQVQGGYTMWYCFTKKYTYCNLKYAGGESDTSNYSYRCTNSDSKCPYGHVQFRVPGPRDDTYDYCAVGDPGGQFLNLNMSIKHLLKPGWNTIFARTVVINGGFFQLKMRTSGCGASQGIETGPPPPVPPSGGQTGVNHWLSGQAGS